MTDGADGLSGREGIDDDLLEDLTLEVRSHPSGAVAARQQQSVEPAPDIGPSDRAEEGGGPDKLVVSGASIAIGAEEPAHADQVGESGDETPGIETPTRHHQFVAFGGSGVRGGESHRMAEVGQNSPTHRHFGGVEVERRNRYQDVGHVVILSHIRAWARRLQLFETVRPMEHWHATPSPAGGSCERTVPEATMGSATV
jgi:hypothetical protein